MTLLGLLLLALIVLGAFMFVRQVRFGASAQRLARIIDSEGGFGRDDLPRDAKGRVEPEAAAEELARAQAAVEAAQDDWRLWFRLGVAFGDTKQPDAARSAVRRAVAIERAERSSGRS